MAEAEPLAATVSEKTAASSSSEEEGARNSAEADDSVEGSSEV